ncbi:lytic polysaccharide monooxygenase [Paenibacillus sp. L3-i20]|uniref:lytic polysaccharide monooxygenase n=1 Tax=Paenibacillus sp. L3-i20 TaxID=2905833 RepID=UPI001EDDF807|nr:lytic polysaccharide monooxygenase [Paenibacillus sp. L3-i20]GKU79148.1 chitin-binding protein [Paenibacillus sp. L3-i20]
MSTVRFSQPGRAKMLIAGSVILALVVSMFFIVSQKASAHGFVNNPSSRGALCESGVNLNCGSIQYEPYSLEGLKGFPNAGPPDGKIASANVGQFSIMDQQSATRWSKVNISAGTNTFNWNIKVPHATASWKYYITKQNWDPNAPLSRASFDLTPFCNVAYSGTPGTSYSDTCNVPSRTGYQIILAVWEVSNTLNAFYNVIDVNFGGTVDNVAPTAPASLAASGISATGASLAWNASTDNVGVTGYRIFNGATQIGSTTGATSFNLSGLTANTAYSISVKAVDQAGNVSSSSNIANFTTLNSSGPDVIAPTAPTTLHVMGTSTATTVPLMWSASTDNIGVTGYRIFRGTTLVATVSGTTLQYSVTGLTANTAYAFSVRAIDAAGNVSGSSNVLNVTTPSASTTYPAWSASVAYTTGNKVTYNGVNYEAKWWTQGETPGTANATVWKVIP